MYDERIGFLTDYGLDDAYVAVCHGVIARIAPATRVIDIAHTVPPQDVARGAEVLARAAPYLAPAVFVGVVDPGVGTARRPVAIVAGEAVLIGPDNGLLLAAAGALGGVREAYELANPDLWRHPVSQTFHGREIFAPVAAHLTLGVPIEDVGPALIPDTLLRLPPPRNEVTAGAIRTEVTGVDVFGNVQLAATADDLGRAGLAGRDGVVLLHGTEATLLPLRQRFADVPEGSAVVLVDSDGRLAVAVNQGRADTALGLAEGVSVEVTAAR